MRRLIHFIAGNRRVFSLLIAVILSLGMMFMGESNRTRFGRSVTTTIFNTGRFTFSWAIYVSDLWRENKRLRIQNLELSDRINFHDNAIRENERLRKLLDFRERSGLAGSVIAATVIGHDFDRVVNSLILNRGIRDGVRKNMAVITAEGLVGRIYETYYSSSSVLVLMDADSRVSAVTGNVSGIIRWDGGPYLRMYGLPLTNTPPVGGEVYTTGIGGVFPPGLFIGTIESTRADEADVERYASVNVRPAVDFSRVQEVFVVKGTERSDVWTDGEGNFLRPEIQ